MQTQNKRFDPRWKFREGTASSGFTLIELMIVVGIVALLAFIAIPGYNEQVRKTRRATAKSVIMSNVQSLERFNTVNSTFIAAPCTGTNQFYTITCINLTALTYTVTATRVAGSDQATDKCGNFSVDQTGSRTIASAASGITAADCW